MKILIADDNEHNLKLLEVQLQSEGFDVVSAADGAQALALLKRETADVLITDVFMPNMDGYRLSLEVRRLPTTKNLPIIIYSATHCSPSDRKLALECGADIFLEKPTSATDLVEHIHSIIYKKQPQTTVMKLPQETEVMKQYNEILVRRMEEKNAELEVKVVQLESLLGAMVGRENRMIELKKEVNSLCRELGRAEPYDLTMLK